MLSSFFQNLCPELSQQEIEKIAFQTGFCKRKGKKIFPLDFLSFICQESVKGTLSFNDIAAKISSEQPCNASRQAFFYRTSPEALDFFQRILAAVMKHKHHLSHKRSYDLCNKFNRILIQDSTIVRLPAKLYEIFSGVKNAHKKVCNARIQGVFDLISGEFIMFSIDPYSCNDLKVADNLDVKEGDLVIRDRGYFTIGSMAKIKGNNADLIIRYKHKNIFYDQVSLKEINLAERLKQCGAMDTIVLAGADKKTKLRIIAIPVREEVANQRRMKAKKEAKDRQCSAELLELLSWSIFITTILDENFTADNACQIYALRWRIECIFKTWKSNFSFDKIHNVSHIQLKILLHARFIIITLFFQRLFVPLESLVFHDSGKNLSLMKFMRYISKNFESFIMQFALPDNIDYILKLLGRYCTFDKRKRPFFEQFFREISW